MAELNQNDPIEQIDGQETLDGQGEQIPTVDELLEQIAGFKTTISQQNATITKQKSSIDRLCKEAAERKRQDYQKMTAQEQEEEARREAEEQHKAYVKELEEYKARMESKDRHMAMGMTAEMADEAAQLELGSDRDGLTAIYKKFFEETKAAQRKADEIEFKTRPDPANGGKEEDAFLKGFNSTRPTYY